MSNKVFVDTNVLIYSISKDPVKKLKAKAIILSSDEIFISSQVINEFINVSTRKKLLTIDEIKDITNKFFASLNFSIISQQTIKKAIELHEKLKLSYWDCLMVASALENECITLYSEDLHHGQLIEDKMNIINPFN